MWMKIEGGWILFFGAGFSPRGAFPKKWSGQKNAKKVL
jgi:hypothetical protein